MLISGIDLGGTKLSLAVFTESGKVLHKTTMALNNRTGKQVGQLITTAIKELVTQQQAVGNRISAIGIAVPGISHNKTGTVWAPNIPGWDDYPLLDEVIQISGGIPITIDSDRACYILGESWQGNAKGCNDAIYLAVGTGIGAGILTGGHVLRGAHDIAGAIGWMALNRPFDNKYISCGCFEYHASGEGIVKVAGEMLRDNKMYSGELRDKTLSELTARDVFTAYENNDAVAIDVIKQCIEFWGMAIANLVSLFNPEKIILGGGVFGPATQFISAIKNEAHKWAQPVSMKQVSIESSALGTDAGLYGAALLACKT
ncbi:MAG TPA: ROK family protein [Chitinophagaceae bacterium]